MVITIINGVVKDLPIYRRYTKRVDEEDMRMECLFFVYTNEQVTGEEIAVPVKAIGKCADLCYAHINVGTKVELQGSFYCNDKVYYFIARDGEFKQPKARTTMQLTSSEFINIYSPASVMERVVSNAIKEKIKK